MSFDGPTISTTVRALIQAKQYLEKHGWCNDGPRNSRGQVCVLESLAIVSPSWEGIPYLRKVLGERYQNIHTIGVWNDTPGRTLEEVYVLFDRAIELAMVEG